jgi:ABC-type branched-subunit amino acid transport system substrate-binding protein
VDDPDWLVAVAGLGISLDTTRRAIATLASNGIPMVAARLTADDLSTDPQRDGSESDPEQDGIEGLVRVAPTNSDQAAAAVAYLKDRPHKTLLVQDIAKGNPYVQTLGQTFTTAFRKAFSDVGETLIPQVEEYDSSKPGVPSTFVEMMPSICLQQPDVVYFAGRGIDLQDFITALPRRPCLNHPINIVTGDSGVFAAAPLQRLSDEEQAQYANVTVRYTALAHPEAWTEAPDSFLPDSITYLRTSFETIFPNDSLEDGGAIMGHDAVLTAVKAIRRRQSLTANPQPDTIPSPGVVINRMKRLHGDAAVPGASGWISLNGRGDPIDKAIPLLELRRDGTVAFVQLTAPSLDGVPFRPPSS